MAIDPVRQIIEQEFDTPFVTDLPRALGRLAALEPSIDPPYLTLGLDLRPEGARPNRRPGRDYLDQNMAEFLAGFQPHTPAHQSLSADLERVTAFLDGDVDPAVQGLVVVACSAKNVFEALPLGLPVSNRIVTAPTPALREVAQLAEDAPAFAVVLLDQREASLSVVDQAARREGVDVRASGFPRHQSQGGWSQRRYENRGEERIEAFARTVAEETRKVMDELRLDALVLAGDDQIATTLRDTFHETVRDRIVGHVRLDVRADDRDLVEAALPVVTQAEREREAEAVGRIQNGAGPGGGAVAGPVETLTALQAGQVMTLVMNNDFAAPGWADFTFPVYGAGEPPAEHPAAGDAANIVPVPLEEELVRLAFQTGAEIEIVRTAVPVGAAEQADIPEADAPTPRAPAARQLDALGGVGALLRFALDDDRSTARL
ncbi:MAG: host attachment protein [Chloroflexota bacterium]|nr:host attachment protein [Chloroflexota bacterium]